MDVGDDAFENEPPVPETTDHAPVPTLGEFAASVAEVRPHNANWSGPAFAVVGLRGKEIVTSSVLAVHGELLIVHLKVLVLPAAAVNVAEGLVVDENEPPLPETIVHAPLPEVGAFAVKVVDVCPHLV